MCDCLLALQYKIITEWNDIYLIAWRHLIGGVVKYIYIMLVCFI